MPLFDDDMDTKQIPGGGKFQYSATRPDNLEASDYTLVVVAIDFSYSTFDFAKYLLMMLKACVQACLKNPRSENIMLRVIGFNDSVIEVHGFKPLNTINIDEYEEFRPGGYTALYDAKFSGVGSILDYAKTLYDNDFGVNGICFTVTDGLDNRSTTTPAMIKEKIHKAMKGEELDSFTTVLVQLKDKDNPDPDAERMLKKFREEASIDAFIDVSDVTPETLAKLGQLISKSISSYSNSLQTGQPISQQSLTI